MSNLVKAPKNWLNGLERCGECQRCNTRKQVVPGVGNKEDPKLFIILDTVREEENDSEYGTRFTRQGSKLLNDALESLGIDRWTDCYVTSVMKCWKPGSESAGPVEMGRCRGYLDLELDKSKPKIILLMGDLAVKSWFEGRPIQGLQDARGRVYANNWQSVIAMHHPSDVAGDNELLSSWQEDWERVKKAYGERYTR
jgi:DNA polymerase